MTALPSLAPASMAPLRRGESRIVWTAREVRHLRFCVLGWDQPSFAAAVGVNRGTVSRWETGESVPQPRHMLSISRLAAERGYHREEAA